MRRKIIVNDPIHKVMCFGSDDTDREVLKAVIDTEEFQRLRRISQLGLASYVFPGATHSRFCHSLGVAYLGRCVIDHLQEVHAGDDVTSRQLRKFKTSIILSTLLHDVGHGPFSHSFENVLKGFGEIKSEAPMHEDWTAALIKNPNSKISKALESEDFDPVLIASPFMEKPIDSDPKFPQYVKQIISSQLDVDRMDYLLRDSHFAGVSFGEFDVHYLINCMTILNHDGRGARTLGLTKKGVKVFESYAISRQMMNRSVYYHSRVKVLEFMMEEFARTCIALSGKLSRIASLKNLIPPYFRAVYSEIRAKAKDRLPQADFIQAYYNDYVSLTENDIWVLVGAIDRATDSRIPFSLKDLAARLLNRNVLPHEMIQAGKDSLLRMKLKDKGYKEHVDFVIVDLSSTIYKKNSTDKVFVMNSEGPAQEITAYSELISAFHDKAESESLLILIDSQKKRIFEYARDLHAIPSEKSYKAA